MWGSLFFSDEDDSDRGVFLFAVHSWTFSDTLKNLYIFLIEI